MATLIINGVDFSDCIQHLVDVNETPIYVDGINVGMSILGTPIYDRVNTRYQNSFSLKPLPRVRFNQLRKACEPSESTFMMTTSREDTVTVCRGQASLSSYSYALDFDGQRIYTGGVITIDANGAENE